MNIFERLLLAAYYTIGLIKVREQSTQHFLRIHRQRQRPFHFWYTKDEKGAFWYFEDEIGLVEKVGTSVIDALLKIVSLKNLTTWEIVDNRFDFGGNHDYNKNRDCGRGKTSNCV